MDEMEKIGMSSDGPIQKDAVTYDLSFFKNHPIIFIKYLNIIHIEDTKIVSRSRIINQTQKCANGDLKIVMRKFVYGSSL